MDEQERLKRLEWAKQQCSPAFVIFEDVCPNCGGELELDKEGPQIYGFHPEWYDFKCKDCGQAAYVEYSGGDWFSNYG